MAENLAADLLRPAAEEIVKDIVSIVKRQFNYLCCFSRNVEMMRGEANKLEDERAELQGKVDVALRNAEIIVPTVTSWLRDTTQIQDMIKGEIETQIPSAQSHCLNIALRFSLSKKAKKTVEAMEKQRNRVRKFDAISQPAPPPSNELIRMGQTHVFQSRKKLEDNIMKTLSLAEVSIVGLGGMGGVGKTTMAKRIVNSMKTLNIVDEVVIVVVSQPVDMLKIQRDIADYVGLDLSVVESLQARAHKLRVRITNSKRMVIVLDDIWEKINLEDLGIPCGGDFSGCVTLLTSRNNELLNSMGAHLFTMESLPQEEAWFLFKDKAGTGIEHLNLGSIAKEVAEECNGLPVAIVTVGIALKGEMKEGVWQDALDQLRSSKPTGITDVIKQVYMPLRLSYDRLEDPGTKLLFLLCCLFPEDYDISVEDLALYGLGLDMFDVQSLVKTRYRVWAEVKKLKSRGLLLEGDDENKVKMHDVIRDVATFISSKEQIIDSNLMKKGQSNIKSSKWISLFTRPGDESSPHHLIGSKFPELLLLIIHQLSSDDQLIVDNSILKEMKGLRVLSFENVGFGSSPKIIGWPNNLVTLKFVDCGVNSLSFVGGLLNLEVLWCSDCYNIEELPVEIGQLKCLKLLQLFKCNNLKRVAPGIISQLGELEELKIWRSFCGWESSKANVKGEGMNVSLKELESLHKLAYLMIQIEDSSLAGEVINLSPTVVKYQISIGKEKFIESSNYEKAIFLGGLTDEFNHAGSWIRKLLATTAVEALRLTGDGVGNWRNISQTYNTLKTLEIGNSEMLKELVDASTVPQAFVMLQDLRLKNLPGLIQLYDGPIPEGSNYLLGNLRTVEIEECNKLRYLLWLEGAMDVFGLLQKLRISLCEAMEEVIISNENHEDGEPSSMTFPKLETLKLKELPSLKYFWKGSKSIEFPSLEQLEILGCGELKSLVCPMESEQNFTNDDKSPLALCTDKVCPLCADNVCTDKGVGAAKEARQGTWDILGSLKIQDILRSMK